MSARVPLVPLVVLQDTREPVAGGLADHVSDAVTVVREYLPTGDYTARGLEQIAIFERKTLDDLVGSLTRERARFVRECERLAAFPFRCVIVEGSMADLAAGRYTSKATPNSMVGSVCALFADYLLPFVFAESAQGAAVVVERTLRRLHAKHVLAPTAPEGGSAA